MLGLGAQEAGGQGDTVQKKVKGKAVADMRRTMAELRLGACAGSSSIPAALLQFKF